MASIDTRGKDFVLLAFERRGDDWSHATTAELLGPQSELKRVAKKKEGNALPQLEKMGSSRRQQIQEVAKELTAHELGDAAWEPVVIKTIKDYRTDEGKIAVKEFNVLFARRVRKATTPPKAKAAKPAAPPKAKADKPKEKPKEDKPKEEAKSTKYKRNSSLNDAFGQTPLFSLRGEPMDSRGPIPYENAGLAPGIGAERPIGYKPPPPPPAAAAPLPPHQPLGQAPGLLNLDDLLLGDLEPGEIEGIVEMPPDPVYEGRRRERQPEARSRSRRRSSAVPEGARQFRSTPWYSDHPPSSRSSWASDDSAILGEWSDLSSRTSEETYYSSPRSSHRKTYRTIAPVRRFYYRGSGLQPESRLLVESNRRSRPAAIEARRDSIGFEEPLPRRSTQSRPLVHQSRRPESRHEIPPEAPVPPQSYSRERSQQSYADDYMREKEREEAGSRVFNNRRYDFDPRQHRQSRQYY